MLTDLRSAWRVLRTRPAFSAIAILTLALGLGANAVMFTVVRAVLLRPLPYLNPEQLIRVQGRDTKTGERGNLSPADFLDFARTSKRVTSMGAHGFITAFTATDHSGQAERVGGINATAGFLPTLGASFVLGRSFSAEEDRPGVPLVVVISRGLWERRFGAAGDVLGRTLTLNARPATIVGVLGADFRHVESSPDREVEIIVPYRFDTAQPNRGGHFIRAIGRLSPDADVAGARAELDAIAARLEAQYPRDNTDQGVLVDPLHDAMVAGVRPALLMLSAAVGFVLLIACANIANLLLAHGASRRTELAVRTALGAARSRIVRQMLTESLLLAVSGALVGLTLTWWGTRLLTSLDAAGVPRAQDIRVDAAVVLFMLIATIVTALLAGLLPALQASRGDLHHAVREGGRGPSHGALRRPARELLIASQVALALMLLAGAALMLRSFWSLVNVDTGFRAGQVLTFDTALPTATYAEGEQIPFYETLYDRIKALPGVAAVGAANILPLSASYDSRGIQIEAQPAPPERAPSVQARSVSPDYFRAMGIPLLRGRTFSARDRDGGRLVVLVSASMAEKYWPGQDPIGQRITFNSGIPRERQQEVGGPGSREVVGVVGDVKHLALDEPAQPIFYTPQAQQPSYHTMSLVVRTTTDPAALTAAIRQHLASMDRGVPLFRARTLDALVRASVAQPAVRAWVLGAFAAIALTLAVIGVYGVVGYLVSERTQEIGIRLALGAARRAVLQSMVADGLRPVLIGVAAGLAGTLATTRLIEQMLFGVTPTDVPTLAAAVAGLTLAAVFATLIPARRAMRVDPVIALRAQ